ncbi:hypothetical protein BEUL_1724 [Bifidobacterium eulemuris]|uniref:Uncharacterized protein n=1 Tax=Bifidobacterium eulemuris TaxID=1765219 RepID=A0A261G547_9BIFI|nr:hypothetical protein BEUL_1724 [Bifidobacterium eulemuris]
MISPSVPESDGELQLGDLFTLTLTSNSLQTVNLDLSSGIMSVRRNLDAGLKVCGE